MRALALGEIVMADKSMTGPQPPILPLSVARTGGYAAVRSSPADGSCATHPYPCKHPGLDVGGVQGTVVRAPESGTITFVSDGSAPPFVGYGPYLALIKGANFYHLLAHLQPGSMSLGVGSAVTAGQAIATTSSANHTHWEVRKKTTPNFAAGETNLDNNIDPLQWLASARGARVAIYLLAGGAAVALALYLRARR
jgi:murein DD-endopeptidase MepM/ murein hydrolase activator NlpD